MDDESGGEGWTEKELGERGSWKRRREKEVSGGAKPGVRGFEEDRREMDGSEECGAPLYFAREKPRRVSDPPCSAALCRVVIVLASASVH